MQEGLPGRVLRPRPRKRHFYRPKERDEGMTSDYHGRQLPAGIAEIFGLPSDLDASEAHRYSRRVREAELVRREEPTSPPGVEAEGV